jgi:ADP-ribosylglycohydrolase
VSRHLFQDRIVGCLLAGAIGDAVGAHFEGRECGSDLALPDDLQVTDDTQLTLATCESIIEMNTVDPESIAGSFLQWFRERRLTGLGAATLKALRELEVGGHWALSGATGERAAGNGAAMRVAPLAFLLDPDDDDGCQTIRDVCRITHRNDEAYLGALSIVRAIRLVVHGAPLSGELLPILANALPDSRVRDRLLAIGERPLSSREYAANFGVSGYVVDSVGFALLAAAISTDLLTTVEEIVHHGGDSDSIAAMSCQIIGAAHGASVVPLAIAERIDGWAEMERIFREFSQFAIAQS